MGNYRKKIESWKKLKKIVCETLGDLFKGSILFSSNSFSTSSHGNIDLISRHTLGILTTRNRNGVFFLLPWYFLLAHSIQWVPRGQNMWCIVLFYSYSRVIFSSLFFWSPGVIRIPKMGRSPLSDLGDLRWNVSRLLYPTAEQLSDLSRVLGVFHVRCVNQKRRRAEMELFLYLELVNTGCLWSFWYLWVHFLICSCIPRMACTFIDFGIFIWLEETLEIWALNWWFFLRLAQSRGFLYERWGLLWSSMQGG